MDYTSQVLLSFLACFVAFLIGYAVSELKHAKREHERIAAGIEDSRQRHPIR